MTYLVDFLGSKSGYLLFNEHFIKELNKAVIIDYKNQFPEHNILNTYDINLPKTKKVYFFLIYFFRLKKSVLKRGDKIYLHLSNPSLLFVLIGFYLRNKVHITWLVHDLIKQDGHERWYEGDHFLKQLKNDSFIVFNKSTHNYFLQRNLDVLFKPHPSYSLKGNVKLRDSIDVAFVGQLKRSKNVSFVLELMDALNSSGYKCFVGGRIIDLNESEILNLKTANYETVLEYLSDDDILSVIKASKLVLLPYEFISQSGILELCQSLGTAVMTSDAEYFTSYEYKVENFTLPVDKELWLEKIITYLKKVND